MPIQPWWWVISGIYVRIKVGKVWTLQAAIMSTIQFEIPDEILISLKETPDRLSKELWLLGAIMD
jgi:hypothetical protein